MDYPSTSLNAVIVSSAASVPARLIPGLLNRIKGYSSIMTPVLATLLGACGILLLNFSSTFYGKKLALAFANICLKAFISLNSSVYEIYIHPVYQHLKYLY